MSLKPPRQAIALTYDGQQAPTLSAKGDDELAEAILAIARAHDVPVAFDARLRSDAHGSSPGAAASTRRSGTTGAPSRSGPTTPTPATTWRWPSC